MTRWYFQWKFNERHAAAVIAKHTNNPFIGTGLDERLREGGHESLVVAGVIINNSVEATVRIAGNLGFNAYPVADACFIFGRLDGDGRAQSADDVHAMSLANLHVEYCRMVSTSEVLDASR